MEMERRCVLLIVNEIVFDCNQGLHSNAAERLLNIFLIPVAGAFCERNEETNADKSQSLGHSWYALYYVNMTEMKLMFVFQTGCFSIALLIICSLKTLFNKATWYVIFLRWLCLRVKHIRVLNSCACIHRCPLILVSHSSTFSSKTQKSKWCHHHSCRWKKLFWLW